MNAIATQRLHPQPSVWTLQSTVVLLNMCKTEVLFDCLGETIRQCCTRLKKNQMAVFNLHGSKSALDEHVTLESLPRMPNRYNDFIWKLGI